MSLSHLQRIPDQILELEGRQWYPDALILFELDPTGPAHHALVGLAAHVADAVEPLRNLVREGSLRVLQAHVHIQEALEPLLGLLLR